MQKTKNIIINHQESELNLQQNKLNEFVTIDEEIKEIKEMYNELNNYVAIQTPLLNKATENIEHTVIRVESGTSELKKAKVYQSNTKKYLILLCVSIVIVIGIVIGIFLSKK